MLRDLLRGDSRGSKSGGNNAYASNKTRPKTGRNTGGVQSPLWEQDHQKAKNEKLVVDSRSIIVGHQPGFKTLE